MVSKIDTLIDLIKVNNEKLDKVCALITSMAILQETISPEGEIRTAEDVAELLSESFMSAKALDDEFENKAKQYEYHRSEFFFDNSSDESERRDNQGPSEMQFN